MATRNRRKDGKYLRKSRSYVFLRSYDRVVTNRQALGYSLRKSDDAWKSESENGRHISTSSDWGSSGLSCRGVNGDVSSRFDPK
jgi:hypothetical protein